MPDFQTGIPYIPSQTSKKIQNASKRLKIRAREADIRLIEAENDRLKLALEEERRAREEESRDRASKAAQDIIDIATPDEVMRGLTDFWRNGESEDIRAKSLFKLADVYTLSKRDHGADTRSDTLARLAQADDDALDAALNRGVTGQ